MANDPPEQDSRYDWLYESKSGSRPSTRTRASDTRSHAEQRQDGTRVMPTREQPDQGNRGDSPRRSGPPPRGGATGAGGKKRRPRILRIILLLLLAYLIFLLVVPVVAWNRVDRMDAVPDGERVADGSGTNYLLIGSDSRDGLSEEERSTLGTGDAEGTRTDSIMILHVPSGFGGTPVLIAIPRDSYVPIPGHDSNKVNAAFSLGGPKLLVETLENTTTLRIDNYVEIGFGGFVDVVEAVNGVEMCLPDAIEDDKAHIDLAAGCQMLDGSDALGYVRMRYSDPRGDLGRVERQQEFMNAVMKRAVSPSTLLNPIRYWNFGMASGDALTLGEETGVIDMGRFALAMRTISGDGGVAMTVPIEDMGYQTPNGEAVKWDSDEALALFEALNAGNDVPRELLPDNAEDTDGADDSGD